MPAMSLEVGMDDTTTTTTTTTSSPSSSNNETTIEPVYFSNGCFWGRQYDFVQTEQKLLGRSPEEVTAVAGYAAGKIPSDKVCYYYTPEKDTVYERLGHAEAVQVELRAKTPEEKEQQFRSFADTYFKQFRKLPGGKMLRLDPQDAGPGYRNVVGIPGGVGGPLFKILQEANINNMELREGRGGAWDADGAPLEDDLLNVVWVVDSESLPFYQAEKYHQFHDGLGHPFPDSYKKDVKQAVMKAGRLKDSTGCPEYFFLGS